MNDLIKKQIGKEIKKLRVDNDMTIKMLSEVANVNSTTITRYENGNCTDFEVLGKILTACNTDFNIFFTKVYANMHN